jgi:amino acid adenylation domain-containing protein
MSGAPRYPGAHSLFADTAARHPHDVAIERGDRAVTYRELGARAARVAGRLHRQVTPGSVVAILAEDPVDVVTGILGALQAGCAFVPLDPRFPDARLATMIAQSSPACFLAGEGSAARLSPLALEPAPVVLPLGGDGPESAFGEPLTLDPESLCSIYFTSGSSGVPKPIAGRLKGIEHFARWEIEALGVEPGTRVSQLTSPCFDGFLKDVFVPLCAGGTACAPPDRGTVLDLPRLVEWIDRSRIHLLHCVPSLFRAILNQDLTPGMFPELRSVVLAGERVLPADVRRWKEVFGDRVQLVNFYGPTETTIIKLCYFIQSGDEDRPSIPVGKPIRGAAALVVGEDGRPCPPGVEGEIYIRTPFRALGYYRHPGLTREAFVPNPFSADPGDVVYRTGDFGRVLEDGNFEFLGRRDHQVKVRGVRVELGEIENVLRAHPEVADVAVLVREDSAGGAYLCAYVVTRSPLEAAELRKVCAASLPETQVPSAFVSLKELPRTLNGKVDRKALPALANAGDAGDTAVEPEPAGMSPVEELLAGILGQVLSREQVGRHDNFFEIGGHSLLAIRVLSRLRKSLRVELQLNELFETPTVAGLAPKVEAALRQREGAQTPPLEPAARPRSLPLSFAQQRLWFVHQVQPANWAYHIATSLRISGPLLEGVLRRVLDEVVRRHESLRTIFVPGDGEPVQVVAPAAPFPLPVIDLSGLPAGLREPEGRRLGDEEARRPFDLRQGPLVRFALVRLAKTEHAALATLHHIVSDGWSKWLLVQEVTALYQAFAAGRPSPLPELPVQYPDYAAWQRRWLQGEVLEGRLAYWRRRLEGMPERLDLPADRVRPEKPTFRGAFHSFLLPSGLTPPLRQLCRQEGATLFMVLLAAFEALLHRWTGQEDLVVGTVTANRDRQEIEGLIGFFVNSLVLRTDVSGNPTFRELVARVRETTLGAYVHQDIPFDLLVRELQPRRILGQTPLFQVVFALQNVPTLRLELPGLRLVENEVDLSTSKFDLGLFLRETEQGIAGVWNYSTELFEPATVRRMSRHFETLLADLCQRPDSRLTELELDDPEERAAELESSLRRLSELRRARAAQGVVAHV